MKRMMSALAVALVVTSAACSRTDSKPADSSLNKDLSLAAQQKGYTPLDTISAAERAKANTLAAPAPLTRTAETGRVTTHHSTSTREVVHHHSSGGSAGSSTGSSAGTTTTTTTTTSSGTVVKNTRRDAAIGAGVGAIIGATTSRNKVKGGIIGAAVGGILGGVIGNNVDKKKKP